MLKNKKLLFTIFKYAGFAFLILCLFTIFLFFYYTWNIPRPEKFTESPFIQSTKIYDRTGKVLLYNIYGEEKREVISFDKISDNLKHAILASEDARFYEHGGIDLQGILRAILTDLKLRTADQGGSTITQQLIRTVYLTNQKSIARKVREMVLSIELEQRYSKDQIFTWYLNAVPFGQNAYGVEAASQTYFNKPAFDISVAEAAVLAALLPAPSYFSPYGVHKNELLQRKDVVLERMRQVGFITKNQAEMAKKEKLEFAKDLTPIKAPHFVMYIKNYLDNKYGEDYLKEKGLRVYTTIDWEIQQYAEQIIEDADEYNKSKGANNAAAVILNPKNGEILALVGSKNYFAEPYPETGSVLFDPKYDVVTMSLRQPGSAFKPIVYATALKKGFTPNTILWDVKTEFNPSCEPGGNGIVGSNGSACYNPQDYDNKNRGPVTLRTALGCSLNIPAVKALYLAGIQDSIETAKDFGITTLTDTKNYGLALVLGGGAVNLLELTSAYGVFAIDGNYVPPVNILKITDAEGNIIEQNKTQLAKVLDTQIARQINSILSDNNARSPLFGVSSPLYLPGHQVAVKTGTTQNLIDGWTIGYTPSVVLGIWTGNNDNSPTKDIGVGIAAPIWNKIMKKLLAGNQTENFTEPNPAPNNGPEFSGQLSPGDTNSILYYINQNDPQYYLWQKGIDNWLASGGTTNIFP